MRRTVPTQSAFTLLEVVFAIVILGIVASISSSIIVQVYSAYIQQRTVHNASLKSELAINQIANRLLYRINRSVIARNPTTQQFFPLRAVPLAQRDAFRALEWIGYDNDSFSTSNRPGWSGFCDVDWGGYTLPANRSILKTPGSYGGAALNNLQTYYGAAHGAIVFSGFPEYRTDVNGTYTADCMFDTGGDGCIFPITNPAGGIANFTGSSRWDAAHGGDGKMIYTEFYKYALSAFAIVPENPHDLKGSPGFQVWDLRLFYGYQPWEGEIYTQGKSSLLLRNVSVFRFIKETNNVRVKLCVAEQAGIGANNHYSICKEKAVIR